MGIIKAKDLVYEYIRRDEEGNVEGITTAVDNVSLDIAQGQFIAILGHNGSGKSTLAKHINAILNPTEGTLWVDGMDTNEEENIWNIRQTAGMVFQNPDNQIIGQVVEEDVGFGPENMGVPTKEIWERVEESLRAVGMYEFRKHSPNKLSGGQKQRISIARAILRDASVYIFDDSFSALDYLTESNLRKALNKYLQGKTQIIVTQRAATAMRCDKVYVMENGKIVGCGTHKQLLESCQTYKEIYQSQLGGGLDE